MAQATRSGAVRSRQGGRGDVVEAVRSVAATSVVGVEEERER